MTFMSALLGTLLFKICISIKKSYHCLHLSWARITLRWNSYRPDSGTQIDLRISMLATKGKEEYRHIAVMLYNYYANVMRGVMITHGMKSDAECMFGCALRWHPMIHDYGKARSFIEHKMASIFCELRGFFSCVTVI